jgi:hypothetical protein
MTRLGCILVLLLGPSVAWSSQQVANTPTLTAITTSPAVDKLFAGKRFTFTLNGNNFDPNTAHVVFEGPNCSPCVVPNGALTAKTSSEITGSVTINDPGTYQISLENGFSANANRSTSLPIVLALPPSSGATGSSSLPATFVVDNPFCKDRSGYEYNYDPRQKKSSITVLEGNILVGVTDPIANLNSFVDPGRQIFSDSQTKLQPDGSDASRLLVRTFGAGSCEGENKSSNPSYSLLSVSYYVINIVRWQKASNASGDQQPYQVASNDWYLFNTQDGSAIKQKLFHGKFLPELSSSTRIYGSRSVGFLAVHLRGEISQDDFVKLQIKYDVTFARKTPINVQHLETLISILTGLNLGGGGAPKLLPKSPAIKSSAIGLYGGGLVQSIEDLPGDITFDATIAFPQNPGAPLASPVQSALLKFSSAYQTIAFPQNPAAPPTGPAQPAPLKFSSAYHDEGLQHWDVSVGVPVHAINELNYSSTDGVVTGKEVSRLNAYGLFDIYPWATDISNPPAFGYPHVVLGLPFSGKVFNKPFLGLGGIVGFQSLPWIGKFLNTAIPVRLNVYGGVVYNKEFRPATLTVGSHASPAAVANNLRGVRVWKGQIGIEFSIKDVANKLTSSKSK